MDYLSRRHLRPTSSATPLTNMLGLSRPAGSLRGLEPHRTISQDLSNEGQLLQDRFCAIRQSRLGSAVDSIPTPPPPERVSSPKVEVAQKSSKGVKRRLRPEEDPAFDEQSHKRREGETKAFSCHFYKFDPQKHSECLYRGQSAVRHLNVHFERYHYEPVHCPRCYVQFEDRGDAERHILRRICVSSENPSPFLEYVTREKQILLRERRPGDGVSAWFRIWDILFPDHPPPESPYLENADTSILLSSPDSRPRLLSTGTSRAKCGENSEEAVEHHSTERTIESTSKPPSFSYLPGLRTPLRPNLKGLMMVMNPRRGLTLKQ